MSFFFFGNAMLMSFSVILKEKFYGSVHVNKATSLNRCYMSKKICKHSRTPSKVVRVVIKLYEEEEMSGGGQALSWILTWNFLKFYTKICYHCCHSLTVS